MGQIKRIHEMLVKGEITCVELTQKYLDEIMSINAEKTIFSKGDE